MGKQAEIKKLLKQLIRERSKINQKTIAAKVGVSRSYLSQVLSGDREGGYDLISRIASAVGYSLGELELMAGGIKVDPAAYRARCLAILDQFMDQESLIRILQKLVSAEKAGIMGEVEHFIDFSLEKKRIAGGVGSANAKIA